MVALAILALAIVVLSELLDWTGHGGVIDRYLPKARLIQVTRPVRFVLLCGAFGMFMLAQYNRSLGDAFASTTRLLTGRGIGISLSAPTAPTPMSAGSTRAAGAPASPPPGPSGTMLVVTGEEHSPPAVVKIEPSNDSAEQEKAAEERARNDNPQPAPNENSGASPPQAKSSFACDGFNAGEANAENAAFEEMVRLNNAHQYSALIKVCKARIQSNPAWPTPYLFCGLGYLGSSDFRDASDMLRRFQSATSGASGLKGACKQANDYLAGRLSAQ